MGIIRSDYNLVEKHDIGGLCKILGLVKLQNLREDSVDIFREALRLDKRSDQFHDFIFCLNFTKSLKIGNKLPYFIPQLWFVSQIVVFFNDLPDGLQTMNDIHGMFVLPSPVLLDICQNYLQEAVESTAEALL